MIIIVIIVIYSNCDLTSVIFVISLADLIDQLKSSYLNISVVDPDNEGKFNGRQRASCRVIVDTSNMLFDVNGDTTLVVKRSNLDFERQSRWVDFFDLLHYLFPSISFQKSYFGTMIIRATVESIPRFLYISLKHFWASLIFS